MGIARKELLDIRPSVKIETKHLGKENEFGTKKYKRKCLDI